MTNDLSAHGLHLQRKKLVRIRRAYRNRKTRNLHCVKANNEVSTIYAAQYAYKALSVRRLGRFTVASFSLWITCWGAMASARI